MGPAVKITERIPHTETDEVGAQQIREIIAWAAQMLKPGFVAKATEGDPALGWWLVIEGERHKGGPARDEDYQI